MASNNESKGVLCPTTAPDHDSWKSAEPASSILAAQLAPRLPSQGDKTHNPTRETFAQLRQELTGGAYSQLRLDDSVTDVNKLICIILKAGLEPPSPEDGRSSNEDLEKQILDCLEIIQIAVEKAPQALTEISDPKLLGASIPAPLFAWLVLRLINLLRNWDNENIGAKVSTTLSSIVYSQLKPVKQWSSCHSVSALLRACIMDILFSLEEMCFLEPRGFDRKKPSIPTAKGALPVELDKLNIPRAIFEGRVSFETQQHAITIALRLLTSFSSKPKYSLSMRSEDLVARQNLAWIMNSYQRLWRVILNWHQSTGATAFDSTAWTFLQFLTSFRTYCEQEPSRSGILSPDMELTRTWIQFLGEIFGLKSFNQMPALQLGLSPFLGGLQEASKSSCMLLQYVEYTILPALIDIKRDAVYKTLEPELQNVVQCLLERLDPVNSENAGTYRTPSCYKSKNNTPGILTVQEFRLAWQRKPGDKGVQASKRLCVPHLHVELETQNTHQQFLVISTLMHSGHCENLQELKHAVIHSFAKLTEHEKCEVLSALGKIACAMTGNLLTRSVGTSSKDVPFCQACDSGDCENDSLLSWQCSEFDELWSILANVLPNLSRAPGLRITAMIALRRVLVHAPNSSQMQLISSVFGEFCLHSLRSSMRELRIITGHTITAFIRKNLDPEIRQSNFVIILKWLRNLSEKQEMSLHEICILTLCRLAKISNDEEMNIILLRLVEYLGHTNPFVCAVAYAELSKLAQHSSQTPAGLFRPYWRTISVTVAKNFQCRPYMAEQLCDLLGMKVDDFLRLTEPYILPYLVLSRKRDMISRVGATYKEVKSPFDICSEKNNLAAILAFLLSQPSPNPEGMTMSVLAEVDSAFKGRTLAELVRTEPILIACDLLKSLGDLGNDGKGMESRFHRALNLLAALVPRKSAHSSISKKANLLGYFVEEHVLGIITQFAHAVNDFQVRQPLPEKKRNIMAIGAMIKIARGHVSSALPQICACLKSALEISDLCDYAFAAWGVLTKSLDRDEVEPLIDQTLSIVIRYWGVFTKASRMYAYEIVEHILKNHDGLVRAIFGAIPSLASIPAMAKFENWLVELKGQMDVRNQFFAFVRRCQSESATVVQQALTELESYLSKHEDFLHSSVLSEQPDPVVAQLVRSLLDCCVKFNTSSDPITILSARCLGFIGCLDPNRVDSVKEKKDILVLSNFDRMEETFDFILFFLQHVLVEAFLSASNTRAQGFLAYAMQNLLRLCHLDSAVTQRYRDVQADEKYHRWLELPEAVRNTLTPFLTSKYTVTIGAINSSCKYPLFSAGMTHVEWLRTFVQDLLQKGSGDNAQLIFSVCSRIVKGQDISIASFLLPFAALNRIVGGSEKECMDLQYELITVLSHPLPEASNYVNENIILCSQSVFEILDYLSRWLQGKKKQLNSMSSHGPHTGRTHKETARNSLAETYSSHIKAVESLLASIPPEVISKRAVECKSFSRALFHWEQYIRQCKNQTNKQERTNIEPLYQRLQDIYSQIDEPDGIEGISAHLHVLNIDQQVLEHRKAGRWATAQSWYELQLEKEPENGDAQWNLLTCLKESGQQDAILTRFEILKNNGSAPSRLLPFAVEASWITGRWAKLHNYLQLCSEQETGGFNIGIGSALNAFRQGDKLTFRETINGLRLNVAKSLTGNTVTSLQSCHDSILKLHALVEVECIANSDNERGNPRSVVSDALDRRLDILGGYITDKQYLLGLRRATMELAGNYTDSDIAAAWLTSARLSRKGNFIHQAYHSMLHAARLKDRSATIEHARLLWKDGHHRKAIQILKGAIAANEFAANPSSSGDTESNSDRHQNILAARAHLLLAKWTDRAGQTQSDVIVQIYREAIKLHGRWEKAHYYLGKHYNKILDSEKAKPLGKEAQIYLSGEASKLVIDNYLRSLSFGNKYVFQTLPKVLTLWLEHASTVDQPFDPKRGDNEEFQTHTLNQRKRSLDDMHLQLKKYMTRMPAALLFTILPQVVARICHPNRTIYDLLIRIVTKAVNAFPQQGLWTVLAVVKSSSRDRASRGINCLHKITEVNKKSKAEHSSEMRNMIIQGQKFSEEMLQLCVTRIEDKSSRISLARSLGFNHKVAPCQLVVPFQAMLTPSLPASHESEYLKGFNAFPRDPTTIEAVLDGAQVLKSLQKPRKIGIRGSDGKNYNILCKPKDDLRKDQRLMEFNNMINRFLKRDVESSKRRMYIKTYAVTPLNEECGLIEWVDNLRTLRELVIKLLRERGITPNYNEIKHYLDEACSDMSKLSLFTTKVLAKFPSVLHEWFVEMFPETGAWFVARLKYTRSCAVMSMVGYVLGLGDRHGENILFEEGTGGVLHVDFNCLFDKGLTFDKPELVPFRLTQNMIDAFGAYGYNGPFRRTCEISLGLLRQNEDALMTVLETFLHDPTTDFIGRKRRTHACVPETPTGVLENVRNKLRGLLPGESVPLSVDGHVDELIMQATDHKNLAAMYIGWCPFF